MSRGTVGTVVCNPLKSLSGNGGGGGSARSARLFVSCWKHWVSPNGTEGGAQPPIPPIAQGGALGSALGPLGTREKETGRHPN
jgi:hypothetical protein